ncbi:MAG: hypothetical protein EOM59_21150 [Clostridia bacterium]|nr:hypothetical protein [Clostridia bacterium]
MNANDSKVISQIDSILSDFPAQDIKEKLNFSFAQVLQMSDGMLGSDLADIFELFNRISEVFQKRVLAEE